MATCSFYDLTYIFNLWLFYVNHNFLCSPPPPPHLPINKYLFGGWGKGWIKQNYLSKTTKNSFNILNIFILSSQITTYFTNRINCNILTHFIMKVWLKCRGQINFSKIPYHTLPLNLPRLTSRWSKLCSKI